VGFHDPRRRHPSIGYLSPIDYEHRQQMTTSLLAQTSLPSCEAGGAAIGAIAGIAGLVAGIWLPAGCW